MTFSISTTSLLMLSSIVSYGVSILTSDVTSKYNLCIA